MCKSSHAENVYAPDAVIMQHQLTNQADMYRWWHAACCTYLHSYICCGTQTHRPHLGHCLNDHVQADKEHECVVQYSDALHVKGFAILHEPLAQVHAKYI